MIRKKISTIIESDNNPTFSYWNDILNYYKQYQGNLDLDELNTLANESERCRNQLNKQIDAKIEQSDVNPSIQIEVNITKYNK